MLNILRLTLLACLLVFTTTVSANPVGQPAPDFSLPDRKSETVSLQQQQGKVVFINFWASWCPPCRIEFPELIKLAQHFSKDRFVLLAINVEKDQENIDVFLKALPALPDNFMVLSDPDLVVVKKFDVVGMPSSVIIGPDGVVKHTQAGFHPSDPEKWRTLIDSLKQP